MTSASDLTIETGPTNPTDIQAQAADPTDTDDAAGRNGHIGRVVAGSILGGLLTSVALVVGPLAGAREHVITGSVLITFAVAWAMLGVWSERRTTQPQRWAYVPAALMGAAGAFILLVAPTGNELGLIWPFAIIALTAWMVVRARRDLHSRTRVWLLYPVFAALMLSAIGGLYETYQETTAPSFARPGHLVSVGDHRLHISCTGTGSPTVVLEPGLGEPSPAMALVAAHVASTTRVCSYDRAGRGWSESASGALDGVETATDLHTLLQNAGERGPFVLAGHSAGGIYVLNFAHLYPEQVAGIVLLDSMSPEQYTKVPSWPAFYQGFRRFSAVQPSLSRLGVGHAMYQGAYAELPEPARSEQRAFWASPRHSRSVRDEFSRIRTAMAQAGQLTTIGDRPLVVLTGAKGESGGWAAAQDDLATLSTNSVHRTVAGASHASFVESRTVSAQSGQAIVDVVGAIRTGTPVH